MQVALLEVAEPVRVTSNNSIFHRQRFAITMSDDSLLNQALATYASHFKSSAELAVFAPGRVNLIGEHTDYNDGFVLPFAIPFRTVVVGGFAKNGSTTTTIMSCNMTKDNIITFDINENLVPGNPSWSNYVKGACYQYFMNESKIKNASHPCAFNAVIISNVPIGSGLSSSASLEIGIATFIENLYDLNTSGVDKALRCQQSEHTFVKIPCGIMDQYISAMGKEGHLLLLDCRTNEYQLVPFGNDAESPVIVVTNSNVKHELSGSEYPDRVRQCKEATAAIAAIFPEVHALRDATLKKLEETKKRSSLSQEAYQRALHVIGEDDRTMNAVRALKKGDYDTVGKLMTASHRSLQHNYEVSCAELDLLVDAALTVPGVYGSRMTGGGFGGCTVTLVAKKDAQNLKDHLKKIYPLGESYEFTPAGGCGKLDIGSTGCSGAFEEDEESSTLGFDGFLGPWLLPTTIAVAAATLVAFVLMRKR